MDVNGWVKGVIGLWVMSFKLSTCKKKMIQTQLKHCHIINLYIQI
jgi:hypothetical protein